jgi:hypothetical protein
MLHSRETQFESGEPSWVLFFMKLAMNSEDLQDLILTMPWFSGGK